MSRSKIKLSSLLLNSIVLVIMTVMVVEIEEKSESQSSTADSIPKLSTICPTPDPGIFAQKPNNEDYSSSDKQHPMIVPNPSTYKDRSESDFVINWCYQIAQYFPSSKGLKSQQVNLTPKYKQ